MVLINCDKTVIYLCGIPEEVDEEEGKGLPCYTRKMRGHRNMKGWRVCCVF